MRFLLGLFRALQFLLDKLLCLVVLAAGALTLAWFHTTLPQAGDPYITRYAPDLHNWLPDPTDPSLMQRYTIIGSVLLAIGVLTFLPRLPKLAKRVIKFSADKGDIDVNLKAVQSTLNKVMNALPEVKSIRINVVPSRDKKRISLYADAVLIKDVGRSARAVFEHVKKSMHVAAANLLGGDMVVRSELYVDSFVFARNTNVVDIAALPADESDRGYLTQQPNASWEESDTSAGPSYLPGAELPDSSESEADKLDGVELPQPEKDASYYQSEGAIENYEDTPVVLPDDEEEAAPASPAESPFEVPKERRDPVDSIDQIIMADDDEDEAGANSQPMFADEEDEKSERGY